MSATAIPLNVVTSSAYADALLYGVQWLSEEGSALITYSFPDYASAWDDYTAGSEPTQGFTFLATKTEKYAARDALLSWSHIANVRFEETNEQLGGVGDIRFGYTRHDMAATELAYSYAPNDDSTGGDIWLNAQLRNTLYRSFDSGSLANYALLHEIGHALGLKHPGSASPYVTATLATTEDHIFNSIESYNAVAGVPLTLDNIDRLPSTPMALDIDAIQLLYGANATFANEDSVYKFDSRGRYLETLYDTGGIDTIQISGSHAARVDLRPDQWSEIGMPVQIDGGTIECVNTVRIYKTTNIENATGGSGSNVLIGNSLDNRLIGNQGNDTLQGLDGDDTIKGGTGRDEITSGAGSDVLAGGGGADRFFFDSWTYVAADAAGDIDTLLDFSESDMLIFDTRVFGQLAESTAANLIQGKSALDQNDYLIYDHVTGDLFFDPDGSGTDYLQQQIALIKGTGAVSLGFDDLGFI